MQNYLKYKLITSEFIGGDEQKRAVEKSINRYGTILYNSSELQ